MRFICIFLVSLLAYGAKAQLRVAVFGDSLTAGYNLPALDAYPAQLESALKARGHRVDITNLGVSGDTTQSGLERLEWSMNSPFQGVILALGANDALRGLSPEVTKKNLEAMILAFKGKGMKVLLMGMLAPPNLGKDYGERFNALFQELAKTHDLQLYPFFLEGVAGMPELNQKDGIHPTKEGVQVMVQKSLPLIENYLKVIK